MPRSTTRTTVIGHYYTPQERIEYVIESDPDGTPRRGYIFNTHKGERLSAYMTPERTRREWTLQRAELDRQRAENAEMERELSEPRA